MWSVGFQKYLKEILEAFLGEISYQGTTGSTDFQLTLSRKGEETILVKLVEEQATYQEELSYEKMYELVVKDNKLDYLYLFQDVLDELKDPNAKEIMIKSYIKEILQNMSPVFIERKGDMKAIDEGPKIELTSGVKFVDNGVRYEQLALAI